MRKRLEVIVGDQALPAGAVLPQIEPVVAYIRKSTDRAGTQVLSEEMQRSQIDKYCNLNLKPFAVRYVYERASAKTVSGRPELLRVMELARGKQFEHLVVWDTTRLTREITSGLKLLYELQDLGIRIHSVQDPIDLTTPTGRLQNTIKVAFGQYEREMIGLRTREGLKHCRVRPEDADVSSAMRRRYEQGKQKSGQPPYGFRWALSMHRGQRKLVPNVEEVRWIQFVRRLRRAGYSIRKIYGELQRQGWRSRAGGIRPRWGYIRRWYKDDELYGFTDEWVDQREKPLVPSETRGSLDSTPGQGVDRQAMDQ